MWPWLDRLGHRFPSLGRHSTPSTHRCRSSARPSPPPAALQVIRLSLVGAPKRDFDESLLKRPINKSGSASATGKQGVVALGAAGKQGAAAGKQSAAAGKQAAGAQGAAAGKQAAGAQGAAAGKQAAGVQGAPAGKQAAGVQGAAAGKRGAPPTRQAAAQRREAAVRPSGEAEVAQQQQQGGAEGAMRLVERRLPPGVRFGIPAMDKQVGRGEPACARREGGWGVCGEGTRWMKVGCLKGPTRHS